MSTTGRTLMTIVILLTVVAAAGAQMTPVPPAAKEKMQTQIQTHPIPYKLPWVAGTVKWPPTSAGKPANTNAATACGKVNVAVARKTQSNAWQTVKEGKATPANAGNYAAGCSFKLVSIPKNEPLFITATYQGAWNPALGQHEQVFSDSIPFTLTGDSMTFTLPLKVVAVPW